MRRIIGRLVFVAQWIAVVLAPLFLIVLPGSGSPGWTGIAALVLSPVIAIALLVGPIVTVSVRAVRRAGTAPFAYSVLSILLWIVVLVVALSAEGSSDIKSYDSSLEGLGLTSAADSAVNVAAGALAIGLWLTSIVAVVVGAVRASRAARQPAPADEIGDAVF